MWQRLASSSSCMMKKCMMSVHSIVFLDLGCIMFARSNHNEDNENTFVHRCECKAPWIGCLYPGTDHVLIAGGNEQKPPNLEMHCFLHMATNWNFHGIPAGRGLLKRSWWCERKGQRVTRIIRQEMQKPKKRLSWTFSKRGLLWAAWKKSP